MPVPVVICLLGPTASGKTALAVEIVKRFPCEIISVDSVMVYRSLDIGTAKPSAELQRIAPHRLLDIRDPHESYSAGDFKNDAVNEIDAILKKNKIPLLVGGTMLYFHILEQGLANIPTANAELRLQIQTEANNLSWPALHDQLTKIDPAAARRIHPQDSQRIQRALEVYLLTGKPISAYQQHTLATPAYRFQHLVLCPQDRALLHRRIENRFYNMLELGFMNEVERLYQRSDLSLENPALRAVGYRQAWAYLCGTLSFAEMQQQAIAATRQLAKRQLTWLKRWQQATWLDSENSQVVTQAMTSISTFIAGSA